MGCRKVRKNLDGTGLDMAIAATKLRRELGGRQSHADT